MAGGRESDRDVGRWRKSEGAEVAFYGHQFILL